jgi:hypothetical protein
MYHPNQLYVIALDCLTTQSVGLLAIVLIERLQETVKKEIRIIHGFSKTIPTIMALFICKYTYAKYGRV